MKTPRARKASKSRRRAAAARLLRAGMALRAGRETLTRAYDWAQEHSNPRFGALRMPRRADISHLREANPLLLGAVGLGLGVAIGSMFPRGMSRRRPMAAARMGNSQMAAPVKAAARRRKKSRSVRARAAQAAAT